MLPMTAAERDYVDVSRRYPKMFVVEDFAKVVTWGGLVEGEEDNKLELAAALFGLSGGEEVAFEHECVEVEDEGEGGKDSGKASKEKEVKGEKKGREKSEGLGGGASADAAGVKWNAKVVLSCGLGEASLGRAEPKHLHQLLRFVSVRKDRSGIMCLGGAWSEDQDGCGEGGVPDTDALVRCATRHVQEMVGLDLTPCTRWLRFLEVHYQKEDREDRGPRGPALRTEITVSIQSSCSGHLSCEWRADVQPLVKSVGLVLNCEGDHSCEWWADVQPLVKSINRVLNCEGDPSCEWWADVQPLVNSVSCFLTCEGDPSCEWWADVQPLAKSFSCALISDRLSVCCELTHVSAGSDP
jgi:hypothetical protein